ncbi:amidohydrolase [Rhodalgimonas zhirmunskyi]|uniref:Amidohydrolase n=1 Tax=Rhodalgimonas zhirmunskyi TaxID=2964767 RepID=A0AAJ1X3Q7_9RHOB|nr:amidohydrolase [Rhodoalgimonas zhirmunskyi]MDQ2092751.1 amidohydrolase [Rhodoalgimonas zhirmunskyi]
MQADTVILNGRLITFDEARPAAQAIALASGRIAAVGSTDEIRAMAGANTRVIDAQGNTVLPGFIDSHVHLFGGSAELDMLDLYGLAGMEAITAAVRPYAAANPDDEVVLAIMADYHLFGDRPTTRHDLDQVLPDRPLALFAADHHTIWANTKALELGGVLHGGMVEQGAEIVMADDGLASGELREAGAYGPVFNRTRFGGRELLGMLTGADPVPPASAAQRAMDKEALVRGLKHCASHGITGLHNMDGNFYTMELLAELEQAGDLICRTEVPFHFKSFNSLDRFEEAQEMHRRYQGERLWCNRVKMFMDGVVESSTALMLRPYPGLETIGDAVFDPELFNAACVRADALGLQIATHAIGDLAVRRTLDGYEAARNANGARDSRHRIEHIETLHADDLPRFGTLGVVPSMQPGHAPRGGFFPPDGLDERLYDDQKPLAFAWKDLRAVSERLCFSTDWPVIPVDVMPTIKAAVSPVDMPAPWTDQRQGLHETLKSYTADNAWLEFNEGKKGQLIAGQMADVVVMSHDLEAMAPDELDQSRAAITLCGGEVTWEA